MIKGANKGGHRAPDRRAPGTKISTAVKKPASWDAAVSAAYLRLLGSTQAEAAMHVGFSIRAVAAWEASDWWPTAENEARVRWLKGGDAMARKALTRAMRDAGSDASGTARWWAERRMSEFAPPTQRNEHSGPGGGPIQVFQVEFVDAEKDKQ